MSCSAHAGGIGIELLLGDGAIVIQELHEELEASWVAVSNGIVVEGMDINFGDDVDELPFEHIVNGMLEAEDALVLMVLMVDLSDLHSGVTMWVIRIHWQIDGSNEGDMVGKGSEFNSVHGENEMAMEAIATVRVNGGDITIELALEDVEGGVKIRNASDESECCGGEQPVR